MFGPVKFLWTVIQTRENLEQDLESLNDAIDEKIKERKAELMEKWEKDLELKGMLADSFAETCTMSSNVAALAESVRRSVAGQEVTLSTDPMVQCLFEVGTGHVIVSKKRTFEAAAAYKGKKTAVLNFASPFAPAGFGKKETCTQEECLCRESTLYACLNDGKCHARFYNPHKETDEDFTTPPYKNNADLIYTPDVTVFKTYDKVPRPMPERDWFNVDVITMAAPQVNRRSRIGEYELLKIFETRFTRIMAAAVGHGVRALILGAFGCGQFGNDPAIVATGAARALDKYRTAFDAVEFAMGSKKNCRTFSLIMDRHINVGNFNTMSDQ